MDINKYNHISDSNKVLEYEIDDLITEITIKEVNKEKLISKHANLESSISNNNSKELYAAILIILVFTLFASVYYFKHIETENKEIILQKKMITLYEKPNNQSNVVLIDSSYYPVYEIIDSTKYFYKVNYNKNTELITGFIFKETISNN
ncbi:hypothetical protein N5J53_16350 [Empedobacter sp. GD03644]|uniref:hypothetical protein n=1 Tax=Empedobacter sp. GD03644 TaxID=2975358 RepID=UPI00244AB39D|nr:hypothetical protein [Empedobacter sp. GD03644]MDH2208581.1 hypothetical protein [Empedobacter sp. GD03644]